MKNSVGIIGNGRFGQVLSKLLSEDFDIKIYDVAQKSTTLETVLPLSTIFVAVPIRHFENVIAEIAPRLTSKTTIIDVCSVKRYPIDVMKTYLPASIGIIATHPLFGPDSIQQGKQLKIVMHSTRDANNCYEKWKNYFIQKKFKVLEMTPDEHDRLAAKSQSITHFIGRSLEAINSQPTEIDTIGYKNLLAVKEQTCNDNRELFIDLQRYNPYAKKTIELFIEKCIELQKEIREAIKIPE